MSVRPTRSKLKRVLTQVGSCLSLEELAWHFSVLRQVLQSSLPGKAAQLGVEVGGYTVSRGPKPTIEGSEEARASPASNLLSRI